MRKPILTKYPRSEAACTALEESLHRKLPDHDVLVTYGAGVEGWEIEVFAPEMVDTLYGEPIDKKRMAETKKLTKQKRPRKKKVVKDDDNDTESGDRTDKV